MQYINIKEVLSRVLRHPLLQEVTLEQAIQYAIDFLGLFGYSKMYLHKEEELHIEDFRAKLPCDLIEIEMVKDVKSGVCLRSMTDTFNPKDNSLELTFKVQGPIIFTSFKEGNILVAYRAVPIDEEGLPLLIDNPIFLKTLEAYIKKEVFTILFDMSKIALNVYQNAEMQYGKLAAQLMSEFNMPTISEMESLRNQWCSFFEGTHEFSNGFRTVGSRHYVKNH